MRSIVWLGAHKTGTTFLQRILELSSSILSEHGLSYLPLDAFREKYTRPLLYRGHTIRPVYPEYNLNFVFDENIPGLVQHALSPSGIYPEVSNRLATICEFFEFQCPDIYFGIRNYAGYVPSLYCEALKSTKFKSFRNFYISDRHQLNWVNVVDRIRRVVPGSKIYIYKHEDVRGNEAKLLSTVTGIKRQNFAVPDNLEREGFSHQAVQALLAISSEREVARRDVSQSVKKFPKGERWSSFDPWSEDERRDLAELYDNHVDLLKKTGDIEWIDL
ncbi:hypothetical protein BV98_000610 [Sphingobium herbicidovorans NBRC 16415]|uniref:Sulfotransferase n=2 Tax=Sphingobium herbicidovorans TaxID=76947 RepID=A0A086PED4_SPHHM|nr:hypothetical protein BV98_000610 [Sphingobium herbicidovorans NBRC 16415]